MRLEVSAPFLESMNGSVNLLLESGPEKSKCIVVVGGARHYATPRSDLSESTNGWQPTPAGHDRAAPAQRRIGKAVETLGTQEALRLCPGPPGAFKRP
jgi:hypothetical protein